MNNSKKMIQKLNLLTTELRTYILSDQQMNFDDKCKSQLL